MADLEPDEQPAPFGVVGGELDRERCATATTSAGSSRSLVLASIACKVANHCAEARFLTDGPWFRFSDRTGFLASWWHRDEDHHSIALTLAPRSELSHYAYQWNDFAALGRVADRLKAVRSRKCIWGPSRHGPGNNHFLSFHDEDGAMIECCSELARMNADGYQPRDWSMTPGTINQWGGPPPSVPSATGSGADASS